MLKLLKQDLNITTLPSVPTVHQQSAVVKKVMIDKGEIPGLMQFAQATFPPNETVDAHTHDSMYEIYFIEKGSGEMLVNGQIQSLTPGTCLTVELGEVHAVKNTGNDDLVITLISIASVK